MGKKKDLIQMSKCKQNIVLCGICFLNFLLKWVSIEKLFQKEKPKSHLGMSVYDTKLLKRNHPKAVFST